MFFFFFNWEDFIQEYKCEFEVWNVFDKFEHAII